MNAITNGWNVMYMYESNYECMMEKSWNVMNVHVITK